MDTKKIEVEQYSFETKYLDGDNDEFLDAIAPIIGYIVYDFNSLEESLTSFLCELIDDRGDSKGLLLTHKMSFSEKVDVLNRYTTWIIKVCDFGISNNKVIQDLKECNRLRNMVIHAEWENVDKEGYTMVKVIINKDGIQQEYIQFDLESLNKIQDFIVETSNLLDEFQEEFNSF